MKYLKDYSLASTYIRLLIALAVLLTFTLTSVSVKAQCPTTVLASDLRAPTKIILSQNGNLLVAEQGNGPNTGRISILEPNNGERRTLLDGLPSAINNLGGFPAPSGPSGLAMRGRTLFIAIGVGDAALLGPFPGTELPNPNPSVADPKLSLGSTLQHERGEDGQRLHTHRGRSVRVEERGRASVGQREG